METARDVAERMRDDGKGIILDQFANPDNPLNPGAFITGGFILGGGTAINNSNFTNERVLQTGWIGAKYSITPALEIAGAYYHEWQNSFATGGNTGCTGTRWGRRGRTRWCTRRRTSACTSSPRRRRESTADFAPSAVRRIGGKATSIRRPGRSEDSAESARRSVFWHARRRLQCPIGPKMPRCDSPRSKN